MMKIMMTTLIFHHVSHHPSGTSSNGVLDMEKPKHIYDEDDDDDDDDNLLSLILH